MKREEDVVLTEEEKEILRDFEAGEFVSVPEEERKQIEDAIKKSMTKKKSINIRINEQVLHKLKVKALEQGLPYQTLISSILHQYVKK